MIIKTCVDCGAVILSNNVTARRCPVCAERFAERVRKKYKNPPADPLTADVRKADAAGKSYGYWRLDELLKEQKAREELDNLIERNRKRKEHGNAPAAEPVATAATAEKRNDPSASQPGDVDSMMEKIIADAMKQAKENPGQAQGVMFKVPAGDMPMEEVVKHIISAVDKQARKDKNGGLNL